MNYFETTKLRWTRIEGSGCQSVCHQQRIGAETETLQKRPVDQDQPPVLQVLSYFVRVLTHPGHLQEDGLSWSHWTCFALLSVFKNIFKNVQKPSCSTLTLLHAADWGQSFWHLPWQTVPGLQSLHAASSSQLQSLSLASVKPRPWHLKAPSWQTPRRRGLPEPIWAHSCREALAREKNTHDGLMI